jgi:hypothetical protein
VFEANLEEGVRIRVFPRSFDVPCFRGVRESAGSDEEQEQKTAHGSSWLRRGTPMNADERRMNADKANQVGVP